MKTTIMIMERGFITTILHDKEYDNDNDMKTATMMMMLMMRMMMIIFRLPISPQTYNGLTSLGPLTQVVIPRNNRW